MEAWTASIQRDGQPAITEQQAREVVEDLGCQLALGYGEEPECGCWAVVIPDEIRMIIEENGYWMGESDLGLIEIEDN